MPHAVVRPDTLYAWSGPSLLVVNTRGECAEDQRLTGYYSRETRFLRALQLRINGHTPWPCEAAVVAPGTLTFTYVHPEITEPSGGGTGQGGDEENIDHLHVGEARVTLRCWRTAAGKSRFHVLKKAGTLHVVRQPPPEADVGFIHRARALAETTLSPFA